MSPEPEIFGSLIRHEKRIQRLESIMDASGVCHVVYMSRQQVWIDYNELLNFIGISISIL